MLPTAAICGSWSTGSSVNRCMIILMQYLEERPGDFISLDGTVMGKHRGRHHRSITALLLFPSPYGGHGSSVKNDTGSWINV